MSHESWILAINSSIKRHWQRISRARWWQLKYFSCSSRKLGKWSNLTTLQGTNISPQNGILKMIFLFPRWDMLIPWRVYNICQRGPGEFNQTTSPRYWLIRSYLDEAQPGGIHWLAWLFCQFLVLPHVMNLFWGAPGQWWWWCWNIDIWPRANRITYIPGRPWRYGPWRNQDLVFLFLEDQRTQVGTPQTSAKRLQNKHLGKGSLSRDRSNWVIRLGEKKRCRDGHQPNRREYAVYIYIYTYLLYRPYTLIRIDDHSISIYLLPLRLTDLGANLRSTFLQ